MRQLVVCFRCQHSSAPAAFSIFLCHKPRRPRRPPGECPVSQSVSQSVTPVLMCTPNVPRSVAVVTVNATTPAGPGRATAVTSRPHCLHTQQATPIYHAPRQCHRWTVLAAIVRVRGTVTGHSPIYIHVHAAHWPLLTGDATFSRSLGQRCQCHLRPCWGVIARQRINAP